MKIFDFLTRKKGQEIKCENRYEANDNSHENQAVDRIQKKDIIIGSHHERYDIDSIYYPKSFDLNDIIQIMPYEKGCVVDIVHECLIANDDENSLNHMKNSLWSKCANRIILTNDNLRELGLNANNIEIFARGLSTLSDESFYQYCRENNIDFSTFFVSHPHPKLFFSPSDPMFPYMRNGEFNKKFVAMRGCYEVSAFESVPHSVGDAYDRISGALDESLYLKYINSTSKYYLYLKELLGARKDIVLNSLEDDQILHTREF